MGKLQSKRIEYVDAMRGFAILLVVFSHIQYFGYGNFIDNVSDWGGNPLIVRNLIISFMMPLFFFISGFVLYKPGIYWDKESVLKFIIKKH